MTNEAEIRFLHFAGRRVAYTVTGDGPPLVAPAWWVSHLELDWADPGFRELGDPCWEGMAARAIALVALHDGHGVAAMEWVTDAQRRSDRVSDRYVWVSGYVTLGIWRSPRASSPISSSRSRAVCIRTRCELICPSSPPGR